MEETVYTITPISGVEITHSEDTGIVTTAIAVLSIEAAEDMFYSHAQTLRDKLNIPRWRVLAICLRAMIFND
jgi:hypothetical protein